MKKALSIILALTLCVGCMFSITGCSGKKNDGKYKIGIVQLVEHVALDAVRHGQPVGVPPFAGLASGADAFGRRGGKQSGMVEDAALVCHGCSGSYTHTDMAVPDSVPVHPADRHAVAFPQGVLSFGKQDHAGDNFARDTVFYLYLDSGYAGMGHVKLLPPVLSLAFVEVLPTGGKAFVEFYPALALPCLPPHRCFRACQDRVGKGV